MRIIQRNTLLRSYKHESSAKFQHEVFDLPDQGLFKLAFKNRFVLRNTQELKHIRVFNNILRRCQFLAFGSQFIHLFLSIRFAAR